MGVDETDLRALVVRLRGIDGWVGAPHVANAIEAALDRGPTVAVEDVLKGADRLAERHVEGSHARVVLSSVRPFFEREFGEA